MSYADLSIVVLIGLFALALVPRAHLGLAAFPAAYLVGSIAGLPVPEIVSFFPSSFFILIVGVMSLFAVFEITGTMHWILGWTARVVRGHSALIPVIPFALGALLSSIGTLPVAAIAIVAPVSMGLAKEHRLPAFLMAYATLNGVLSGLFSPIAVFGITTTDALDNLNVDMPATSNVLLWLLSMAIGTLLLLVVMALYRKSLRGLPNETHTALSAAADGDTSDAAQTPPTLLTKLATLASLLALIIGGVAFDLDLGLLGFTLSFILLLTLKLEPAQIIARIPWGVVILIGGLLTYLGLMEELDAFTRLSELLSVGDSAVLGLLVLCFIAAITSFLANSIAVIITTLPLLPPLIEGGVNPLGAVTAVLLSAILVDVNPLGAAGGLLMGATDPTQRQLLFRQLLAYGLCAVVIAPLAMWAIFGLW